MADEIRDPSTHQEVVLEVQQLNSARSQWSSMIFRPQQAYLSALHRLLRSHAKTKPLIRKKKHFKQIALNSIENNDASYGVVKCFEENRSTNCGC